MPNTYDAVLNSIYPQRLDNDFLTRKAGTNVSMNGISSVRKKATRKGRTKKAEGSREWQ